MVKIYGLTKPNKRVSFLYNSVGSHDVLTSSGGAGQDIDICGLRDGLPSTPMKRPSSMAYLDEDDIRERYTYCLWQ
jgi:hypothetical protein